MSTETKQPEQVTTAPEAVHPLGKKIKVKVHSLSSAERNHSIFVSINQFTFEFQQNTEVSLPIGVVKFLQDATKASYKVNDKGYQELQNTPLYAVTTLV